MIVNLSPTRRLPFAVIAATALVATSGVAYASGLPAAASDNASAVLQRLGINPGHSDHSTTKPNHPANHGGTVSNLARTTTRPGATKARRSLPSPPRMARISPPGHQSRDLWLRQAMAARSQHWQPPPPPKESTRARPSPQPPAVERARPASTANPETNTARPETNTATPPNLIHPRTLTRVATAAALSSSSPRTPVMTSVARWN